MSYSINNGRRGRILYGELPERDCGIVEHEGKITVAFRVDRQPKPVSSVVIDGQTYQVVSVEASDPKTGGIPGAVFMEVRRNA